MGHAYHQIFVIAVKDMLGINVNTQLFFQIHLMFQKIKMQQFITIGLEDQKNLHLH
jgi:hypothetical protein